MIAATLLIAALVSAPEADPQSQGLQALDQHDYARARDIFAHAAAADPKDYSALFNLAFAEAALHQDADAAEHLKQTLALKPQLFEAELNLGMLYVRDGHAADAIPLLQDAVRQKPSNAGAQRYLGDALLTSGSASAAVEPYEAALKIQPRNAPAELGLGKSLAAAGKLDEAAPHFEAAARLDPHLASYELQLAADYLQAGKPESAVPLLKQFPDDPGALEQLGNIYLNAGKADEAVVAFERAARLSPTAANRLALATAYLRTNRPELAEPILAEAFRSNPNDFDLVSAIAKIELGRKNYRAAAAGFAKAAELKPDSSQTWSNLASSMFLAGQYPQTLSALDRVKALGAEQPGDFYLRAVVYDKLHQPKPALQNYQEFLTLSKGKYPDQEFLARHRSITLEREVNR